ncbi:MAG TPA: T9SS type A sorting domain-containing protein [Chitinophagales bacterium]|nr:T9SS type A sorting domain-containing protein [Chitinophagales bacterium]
MKKISSLLLLLFFFYSAFSQCATPETATRDPLPINGAYLAGTTVTFCYTIDSFEETGSNWFHGVVLHFGPGWDTSTFQVISIPSGCDENGVWGFYQHDSATGSGLEFGPGFYFDRGYDLLDGIPGNNYSDYGDNCNNESWTFCFSVRTDSVCGGDSLSVTATATGDGTSGSFTTSGCDGVPFEMDSNVICEVSCILSVEASSTNISCFGEPTGTGTATVNSGYPPYIYSWSTGATTATVSNLGAGTYSVTIIDSIGCADTAYVIINEPTQLVANAGDDSLACWGQYYPIGGNPTAAGGTPPYHYTWDEIPYIDDPNPVIIAFATTTYHVTVIDTNGCGKKDSVLISVDYCLGIPSVHENFFTAIFPNPNDGHFILQVDKRMLNASSTISVFDVLGKEIFRARIISEKQSFDLTKIPSGIYRLVVKTDNGNVVKSIVKTE